MKRAQQLLPWGLVLLQLVWWSYGVWPITPVEGDEQGVIFGVKGMLHDDSLLLPLRYLYEVQPGSYHLLTFLSHLTGASVEFTFGSVTAAGAVFFALAGARLLRDLNGIPFVWALVGMLWCQEVSAAAYYMNTSAFAAGLAVSALLLASRAAGPAGWFGAGLALGCAGWLRADSLLIAPACLGLIYWRERRWTAALLRTGAIAVIALVSVMLFYRLSHTSLADLFGSYATRPYSVSSWRESRDAAVTLLSPALGLGFIIGIVWLLHQRQHALCGVVLSGTIFSVLAYGNSLTTPKYYYYLVPFALIPSLALARQLAGWITRQPTLPRRCLLATVSILALGDQFVGLRLLHNTTRLMTTAPTWVTLAQARVGTREPALVVGPGELITNADGFRVRTGQGFAPLCWHREKERMVTELAALRSIIEQSSDCTLYWSSWLPRQLLLRELFDMGFAPENPPSPDMPALSDGLWRKGAQIVRVGFLGYLGSPYQPPGPAPASSTPAATFFLGTYGGKWPITELNDRLAWHQVSPVAEGFVTLYRRR
jgi:hypothetical protein